MCNGYDMTIKIFLLGFKNIGHQEKLQLVTQNLCYTMKIHSLWYPQGLKLYCAAVISFMAPGSIILLTEMECSEAIIDNIL